MADKTPIQLEDLPLWLKPDQVAAHLQVSQQTIHNMCKADQLPHRWLEGVGIRISRNELEEETSCLDATRSRTTRSEPTKTVAFPVSSTQQ